ncbi:MAG: hypothetical protein NZ990_00410 [Myxococcota bacterium]|nr:hypothetical protein [Myxococcota bacterium]
MTESAENESTRQAAKQLRDAWDDMMASLETARNAIDQPELMPAPQNPRSLAEGYRYLMGFAHSAIERAFHEDKERPAFRNALSIINRATIDNSDAIYFYAPIDGRENYVIRGHAGDSREWRGQAPAPEGPRAPHYLIFEASAGVLAGDSGDLKELAPGVKTMTGRLDSSDIQVDSQGRFEILLAPERPKGHQGNFVSTLRVVEQPQPSDADAQGERFATYISGRQIFNDWELEEPIHLSITRLAGGPETLSHYTPEQAAAELRRCGELVRGQMHFWNAFWTVLMGVYGPREGSIPGIEFPRNGFNTINAATGATGGGMSTNLYAGGVFELGPDEALVIENRIPLRPQYYGFQIANLWGESLEYAHSFGSLNSSQSEVDPDGVIRLVVAHRDPGVPNWLDTTGHAEGFLTPRWAYSETPPPEQWPSISAKKVPFAEIREHLHPDTRSVTAEERAQRLERRSAHVQKRFRVF